MSALAARLAVARLHLPHSPNAKPIAPVAHGAVLWLFARLQQWRRDVRGRAELARMSLRDLHDIGITPAERDREIDRWFRPF